MANVRGQAAFVTMMLALVFIVLALSFAPILKDFSDQALNDSTDSSVGLNCTNPLLSEQGNANCYATDLLGPYFIGFLIFAAGAIIVAKLLL